MAGWTAGGKYTLTQMMMNIWFYRPLTSVPIYTEPLLHLAKVELLLPYTHFLLDDAPYCIQNSQGKAIHHWYLLEDTRVFPLFQKYRNEMQMELSKKQQIPLKELVIPNAPLAFYRELVKSFSGMRGYRLANCRKRLEIPAVYVEPSSSSLGYQSLVRQIAW